jgi:hypothetical protein
MPSPPTTTPPARRPNGGDPSPSPSVRAESATASGGSVDATGAAVRSGSGLLERDAFARLRGAFAGSPVGCSAAGPEAVAVAVAVVRAAGRDLVFDPLAAVDLRGAGVGPAVVVVQIDENATSAGVWSSRVCQTQPSVELSAGR